MTGAELRQLGLAARQLGADSDIAEGYLIIAAHQLDRSNPVGARLMMERAADWHPLYRPMVAMLGGAQ